MCPDKQKIITSNKAHLNFITLFPKKRLTILETTTVETYISLNPLMFNRPYKVALKHCSFLNLANIALTVSCEHCVECAPNWDIQ